MTWDAADATRIHGPSTDGPPAHLAVCARWGLPADHPLRQALADRAAVGRAKYGVDLAVGWPDARVALVQELLDGAVYAESAGLPDVTDALCDLLIELGVGP